MAKGVGKAALLWAGVNLFTTASGYKQRRHEGHGVIASALGSYVDFRIWSSPWMMIPQIGTPLVQYAIERSTRHIKSVRRSTAPFVTQTLQDNEMIAQSKQALMQSAIGANSRLRLGGHSWSGMEASVLHEI